MKEQIENLLKAEKERIIASDKQKRENHLISSGLIDESKGGRFYFGQNGYNPENAKFDPEKNLHYSGNDVALDVTDEEYIEICKYFPPSNVGVKSSEVGIKSGAETTLSVIATIVLIGGIIGVLISLFTITWVYDSFEGEKVFNPIGFIAALSTLLVSLTIWASMSVLSNISISLKEINSKT